MSDCCSTDHNECGDLPQERMAKPAPCPECRQTGTPVERRTPEHLLTTVPLQRLSGDPHLFCSTPSCPVVYFTADGSSVFLKPDLKVLVTQKETAASVPVCYCFDHSRADIVREITETGSTTIPDRIKAEVKAGTCACEIKNPQGSCCLGNVAQAVKWAKTQVTSAQPASSAPALATAEEGMARKSTSLMMGAGALVAGALASICCLGPAILGAIGLGTLGAAGALEAYRPFLLAGTFALLGSAFYFVYRKHEVRCADGSCRREGAGRGIKAGLWGVTALAMGAAFYPQLKSFAIGACCVPAEATSQQAASGSTGIQNGVVIEVTGMTCEGCAHTIKGALEKVAGVESADVSFETKRAVVRGASGVAGLKRLIAAIKAAGYGAVPAKNDTPAP